MSKTRARLQTWELMKLEHLESKNGGPIKFFMENNKICVFAFPVVFEKKCFFFLYFQKNPEKKNILLII